MKQCDQSQKKEIQYQPATIVDQQQKEIQSLKESNDVYQQYLKHLAWVASASV